MFDLDGTMFDTAPSIANAFNNMLIERGEAPVSFDLVTSHIGYGMKDLLAKMDQSLANRLGDHAKLEIDFTRHYRKNFVSEAKLFPGLVDFLNQWQGHLAIVSNKPEYYVRELIAQTVIKQFRWSVVLGGDSLPTKKPEPTQIFHVLNHLALAPQDALMIGDGLPDIQAAQKANVRSVAVSFGYTPLPQLLTAGAHASIDHYDELPAVIQTFSMA